MAKDLIFRPWHILVIEVSYVNRIVFKFLGTISHFLPHISNYIIDRRGQSEMRKYAKI